MGAGAAGQAGQEAGPATARRRVPVPDDRPGRRPGRGVPPLRPTHDRRGAVPPGRRSLPRPQVRAERLVPSGYAGRGSAPGRLDRLLLILALAYLPLVGLGPHCRRHDRPGMWCSNNRDDTLSDFAIAKAMPGKVAILPATTFRLLLAATIAAVPNWG